MLTVVLMKCFYYMLLILKLKCWMIFKKKKRLWLKDTNQNVKEVNIN